MNKNNCTERVYILKRVLRIKMSEVLLRFVHYDTSSNRTLEREIQYNNKYNQTKKRILK